MMFSAPYVNPFELMPMMDAATAMRMPGSPLNPGPAGPLLDGGPSTINLTDPSRYGTRPGLFGGGPMGSGAMSNAAAPATAAAPVSGGGMFGNGGKPKFDAKGLAMAIAAGLMARRAPGVASALENMALYRLKKGDADKQTADYINALVARGMDPSEAQILAADPAEMAKHFGTRFDAATVDEGSSRYVPNFDGTTNVFTAPKTFTHGADVVQMPGSQTVAPDFTGVSAIPQPLGGPVSVPGLRTDSEQYADSVAPRGTPEWTNAVQDYGLKAYGPSAAGMQQDRLANSLTIAQGHDRTSAANTRYRVDHPAPGRGRQAPAPKPPTPTTVVGAIMDKQARGEALTPSEMNTLRDYRTHYKPQRGAVQISPNEPVAHGPNGQKLVVRDGKWVDAATGKPVQ
jgi:hypothetical protein